jgi:hypothetical protein
MQVFVDEQAYQPQGGTDQTLGQLAAEVGLADPGKPRMVVSLCCDGQPISQDDLGAILDRPARDFERLELHTQPLVAMVRNIMAETIELFDQADQARQKAVDLLAEGQTEAAMHQLQTFFGIWRHVQDAMIVCVQALGSDLDSLDIDGKPLPQVFEPLRNLLNDLKDAMLRQDYVVVSDILGYEFEEPLKGWRALLNHLHDAAKTRDR